MDQGRKDPELRALLRAHGGKDDTGGDREELGRLIRDRRLADAERMVRQRPELIHDEEASWGDGILAGPAHAGDHELIAMLIRLGARVPRSRMGRRTIFQASATAAFCWITVWIPNH